MTRPMTALEWDWVKEHPDDPDARALILLAAMSRSKFTHVEAGLAEAAIEAMRRKIAVEATA